MDWVKIFLDFIADIAWPLSILLILYLYRMPIAEKINRLRSIKHKDIYADFELTEKIQKVLQSNEPVGLFNVTRENCTFEAYMKLLETMGGIVAAAGIYPESPIRDYARTFLPVIINKLQQNDAKNEMLPVLKFLEEKIEAKSKSVSEQ
jgi:hypothetical protein